MLFLERNAAKKENLIKRAANKKFPEDSLYIACMVVSIIVLIIVIFYACVCFLLFLAGGFWILLGLLYVILAIVNLFMIYTYYADRKTLMETGTVRARAPTFREFSDDARSGFKHGPPPVEVAVVDSSASASEGGDCAPAAEESHHHHHHEEEAPDFNV